MPLANSPKTDANPLQCVFITEQDKTALCLGIVSRSLRFCVAYRDGGYSHCSIKMHGRNNKFVPQANCYYLPGGLVHGNPTARSNNCLPLERVPANMRTTFEEGLLPSRKWLHLIIGTLTQVSSKEDDYDLSYNRKEEDMGSRSTYTHYTDDGMDVDCKGKLDLTFNWEDDVSELGEGTDWGPTVRAHCDALNLLRKAVSAAYTNYKPDLEGLLEDIQARLGDLKVLISKHGSVGGGLEVMLKCGNTSMDEVARLQGEMEELGDNLKDYVAVAAVTKEDLLTIITRVNNVARQNMTKALERIKQVKALLGRGPLPRPSSPPSTFRTSMDTLIDIDTPLGTVNIGGNATLLTASMRFTMVHDLQAKVDVLTDQSKGTGVIFNRKAFASESKFLLWFMAKNPSGEGFAGFVDIVSFWTYWISDTGDASQYLVNAKRSKKIGMKGKVEVAYAHSMSTQYSSAFVGNTKEQILSTATILMLLTYEAWRGDGAGDGKKQSLTDRLAACMQGQGQYCEDNISDPELRSMALRSGEATNSFWERLVAYIEDEYSLLMSVKLLAKHVLLLLSNQVVQICDDIYKFCGNAANVDITERGPAAARFAWVTLQAQNCMGAYLKDKFRNHCALNSRFVRFLTRHMSNQTALGLKTEVEKLMREVGDLKAVKAAASQDALDKLDGKVSTIIHLNNLKTRE